MGAPTRKTNARRHGLYARRIDPQDRCGLRGTPLQAGQESLCSMHGLVMHLLDLQARIVGRVQRGWSYFSCRACTAGTGVIRACASLPWMASPSVPAARCRQGAAGSGVLRGWRVWGAGGQSIRSSFVFFRGTNAAFQIFNLQSSIINPLSPAHRSGRLLRVKFRPGCRCPPSHTGGGHLLASAPRIRDCWASPGHLPTGHYHRSAPAGHGCHFQ
jgi:hypothetical protein